MANATIELPLDQIKITNRVRRNLGDLSDLANSMDKRGLLHAIVVTPEYELIAGSRRIKAASLAGKKSAVTWLRM